jgi:peptide/nickel transport system permease protein
LVRYLFIRTVSLIPLLLGISFFCFLLLKLLPGDIAVNLVGERSSPEIVEGIRQQLGADKDIFEQYVGYLSMLLQGNMGRSHITQREVFEEIKKKLPNTIRLAFAAMLIAIPVGVGIGLLSAYYRDRPLETILDTLIISCLSVPVFWGGLLLMLLFSLTFQLVPPSGTGGLAFLILPAFTLAIPAMATLARITKASVIDALAMPSIRTATAKGLRPLRICLIHVLKNALIPIITVVGLDIGSYLNGAVVTETIFGWDGIGRFTMEGVMRRDYPVIIGSIITGATIFVLVNALTDMLYHIIDPRIRFDAKGR